MTTRKETNNNKQQITNGKFPSGIRNGWFTETEALWPGQRFSLALEDFSEESILFSEQSEYQSILVFKSTQYGNVMVLDGVIQLSERDEFSFHEMLTHLPLFSHPNPRNILIVGGGDGHALREVCRHTSVERITLVEIDPKVIQVSKRFFSKSLAGSFDDDRVTIVHDDAAAFLDRFNTTTDEDKFDVIIADSSDPVGPAESLFQPSFYEAMNDALESGGIVCAMGESMWIHFHLIEDVVACCADIFDCVDYAMTMVPTYPCGQIGFFLAGKERGTCSEPEREPSVEMQRELRWYNPRIHRASFVLPQFLEEKLAPLREAAEEEESGGNCFQLSCVIS